MSISSGLFNNLKSITSLGSRIYPLVLPQSPTYPSVVYQRISTYDTQAMDGTQSLDIGRFQIKIYATSYKSAIDTAEIVKTAMSGKGLKLMEMDDYEPETKLFSVVIDYQLSDDIIG